MDAHGQPGAAARRRRPTRLAFWRPVLDQGLDQWARIFAQTPVTPELMAQWKQFLDQWIEAWSKRARAGDEHRGASPR